MAEIDYTKYAREQLLHLLRIRDRQAEMSRKYWVRAAKAALNGDARELRNRVELAEAPPVQVVLSDEKDTP